MRKNSSYFCVVNALIVVTIVGGLANAEPISLGVLNFNSAGKVTSEEVTIITERLRTELVKMNRFVLVERSKMDEILKEQGFQSGSCTDSECLVEFGKILGVKWMITGTVGKLGQTYTIDTRIVDVETAAILYSTSDNLKGEIDEILGIMQEVARKIGSIGSPSEAITLPSVQAIKERRIEIDSNPAGATLYINGEDYGVAPVISVLKDGIYKILLSLPGYVDWQREITIDKDIRLTPFLSPLPATFDGIVIDKFQNELANVSLTLINPATGNIDAQTITDDSGQFSISSVIPRDYYLEFERQGYKSKKLLVAIKTGRNTVQELLSLEGKEGDNISPRIYHSVPNYIERHSPYIVKAVVQENYMIKKVRLHFWDNFMQTLQEIEMKPDAQKPSLYSATIPAEKVVSKELRYFIAAWDEAGNPPAYYGSQAKPVIVKLLPRGFKDKTHISAAYCYGSFGILEKGTGAISPECRGLFLEGFCTDWLSIKVGAYDIIGDYYGSGTYNLEFYSLTGKLSLPIGKGAVRLYVEGGNTLGSGRYKKTEIKYKSEIIRRVDATAGGGVEVIVIPVRLGIHAQFLQMGWNSGYQLRRGVLIVLNAGLVL